MVNFVKLQIRHYDISSKFDAYDAEFKISLLLLLYYCVTLLFISQLHRPNYKILFISSSPFFFSKIFVFEKLSSTIYSSSSYSFTIQLFTKILISEATAASLIWTESAVTVLQFLMNVARRQIDLQPQSCSLCERWGVKRSRYLTDDSRQPEWRQVQMLGETSKEYDATWGVIWYFYAK